MVDRDTLIFPVAIARKGDNMDLVTGCCESTGKGLIRSVQPAHGRLICNRIARRDDADFHCFTSLKAQLRFTKQLPIHPETTTLLRYAKKQVPSPRRTCQ